MGMFHRCSRRSIVSAALLCNWRMYQLSRSKMSFQTRFGRRPANVSGSRCQGRAPSVGSVNGPFAGASGNDEVAPKD
jgi:hypothetical protein